MSSARTSKSRANKNTKKSRFRKAPGAPKRFKSAYIFFSTDMMQKIKKQQHSTGGDKQKITDISKRISSAWKALPPDERSKWDLIARKDKERFIAEKKSYKGPWQLPVKNEDQVSDTERSRSGSDIALLTSESEDSSMSWYDRENKTYLANLCDGDSAVRSFRKSPNSATTPREQERLSFVSQEERDAAHNLVQLFRQPQGRISSPRTQVPSEANQVMPSPGRAGIPSESYRRPTQYSYHPIPRPSNHHAYGFF